MRHMTAAVLILAACTVPDAPPADPTATVQQLLESSADAWNRGDLEGFVGDYARDSGTTFMAGGTVQYGFDWIYGNYSGWWDLGDERDSLRFESVAARALGSDHILATARFVLFRGDSVTASGPFTLVWRRIEGEWKIIHDHTSTDP